MGSPCEEPWLSWINLLKGSFEHCLGERWNENRIWLTKANSCVALSLVRKFTQTKWKGMNHEVGCSSTTLWGLGADGGALSQDHGRAVSNQTFQARKMTSESSLLTRYWYFTKYSRTQFWCECRGAKALVGTSDFQPFPWEDAGEHTCRILALSAMIEKQPFEHLLLCFWNSFHVDFYGMPFLKIYRGESWGPCRSSHPCPSFYVSE